MLKPPLLRKNPSPHTLAKRHGRRWRQETGGPQEPSQPKKPPTDEPWEDNYDSDDERFIEEEGGHGDMPFDLPCDGDDDDYKPASDADSDSEGYNSEEKAKLWGLNRPGLTRADDSEDEEEEEVSEGAGPSCNIS